jgi:hypothetical protein
MMGTGSLLLLLLTSLTVICVFILLKYLRRSKECVKKSLRLRSHLDYLDKNPIKQRPFLYIHLILQS